MLWFLGEKQKALEEFDKALELDPAYEPAIINKHAVSSLDDNEKLPQEKHGGSVEYYKEFSVKKKSLIETLFGRH